MSYQAYLDNIEEKTGKAPADFIVLAKEKGYDDPATKAGIIVDWLKEDFGLGRGHAMALVHVIKNGAKISDKHVGSSGTHRDESNTLKLEGKGKLTVSAYIKVPTSRVWSLWTTPEDIMRWNNASEDWHTPAAQNDLREGGKFIFTMAARDGSVSFDFSGDYTKILDQSRIEYTMFDGRKVVISFQSVDGGTQVTESFDPENENTMELQLNGWQAILNNFKKYAEQSM